MACTAPPVARFLSLGLRLALLGSTASCVSTPKPAEVLATGFRSPEQCFRTFQVAVRADEPGLEYRCFSTRLRAEQHLSQWAWRELRENLWSQPGMRWAVALAKVEAPPSVLGARAELVVGALGKRVHLEFVREDFAELWSGSEKLADSEIEFTRQTGTQEGRWFYGQVEMPAAVDSAKVTEMRLGREWKLDRIDFDGGS